MGLFFNGIPNSAVCSVKAVLGPSFDAIETGTYKGSTAKKLTAIAVHLTAVEANHEFYMKAHKWVNKFDNLSILHVDSGALIGTALPKADMNCMVWLNAHFSGGNTAEQLNPCPLMNELLRVLPLRSAVNSIILIDDSRGLIGTFGWSLLSELIGLLSEYGFSSIIIDDVLIASSAEVLGAFARSYSTSQTFSLKDSVAEFHWSPASGNPGYCNSYGIYGEACEIFV